MGFLFWKSKEERRIERDMQIRKGMHTLERQADKLKDDVQDYKQLAIEAKRAGADGQLKTLRGALKRTIAQERLCRNQLIAIKTAQKMKMQAESHTVFAQSMNAVSSAIAEAFGSVDFAKTQKNYEKAISQAATMQQRAEIFLESTSDAMSAMGPTEGMVSDDEIDRLIDDEAVAAEKDGYDQRIADGMAEARRELER